MNIELLQTKCCDFRFNLTKVKLQNTCHVIVSPVDVLFSNYLGLMKFDVIKKTA